MTVNGSNGFGALVADIDRTVDDWFTPLRSNDAANAIFYNASRAAEFSLGWHALSLVGAVVSPALRPHAARMTVALGVESVLVNGMIKPIFNRRRPDLIDGAPHLRRPKTASFPSGHASSATMAAVLLSDAVPALRPLWYVTGAVVATSRIHARMHHASDVAAGVVVGAAIGMAVKALAPR